jgi:hypothetical protein
LGSIPSTHVRTASMSSGVKSIDHTLLAAVG